MTNEGRNCVFEEKIKIVIVERQRRNIEKKERERSEINYQVIRERGRKKKKGSIKKQEVRNGRKTGRKDQEGIKGGMKKEKGRNNQGRFNQEE